MVVRLLSILILMVVDLTWNANLVDGPTGLNSNLPTSLASGVQAFDVVFDEANSRGLVWFAEGVTASGTGGHLIQSAGGATLTPRTKLNIFGATITDNAANDSTDVTITGGGGGGGLPTTGGIMTGGNRPKYRILY